MKPMHEIFLDAGKLFVVAALALLAKSSITVGVDTEGHTLINTALSGQLLILFIFILVYLLFTWVSTEIKILSLIGDQVQGNFFHFLYTFLAVVVVILLSMGGVLHLSPEGRGLALIFLGISLIAQPLIEMAFVLLNRKRYFNIITKDPIGFSKTGSPLLIRLSCGFPIFVIGLNPDILIDENVIEANYKVYLPILAIIISLIFNLISLRRIIHHVENNARE